MLRCTICGRACDVGDRCGECDAGDVASLAERLLAPAAVPEEGPPPHREAPNPLLEALATEISCPSCHTAIPPASRYCGVCGLRLAAPTSEGAPTPETKRGPP
jgi:hypothetical protein